MLLQMMPRAAGVLRSRMTAPVAYSRLQQDPLERGVLT
jgi:hypothetical protein